jgi:Transposase IS200 like
MVFGSEQAEVPVDNRPMPRTARASQGGFCYHVRNRGNGRRTVFHKDGDFAAFLKLLRQAGERASMRLLAYCLLPNHFHLAVWPRCDGDLSDYMMWLLTRIGCGRVPGQHGQGSLAPYGGPNAAQPRSAPQTTGES